jgi:hypothetical protein
MGPASTWRGGWCLGGVGEDDVDRWARAGAVAVVGRMGGGTPWASENDGSVPGCRVRAAVRGGVDP